MWDKFICALKLEDLILFYLFYRDGLTKGSDNI